MNKWYIYIIENSNNKLYIGATSNLENRIKSHNRSNGPDWTQGKGLWKQIYFEKHQNKKEALKREKQLKSWKAGQKIKKILQIGSE